MTTPLRPIANGFVAVPAAFKGTSEGYIDALKVQLVPRVLVQREPNEDVKQVFDLETMTHRALIDFAEVDTSTIDFQRLQKDCEILKEALSTHRGEFEKALGLVCSGKATQQMVESAAATLAKAGLTEQSFQQQGGGMIGLVIAVVACLLVSGCAHTRKIKRGWTGD